MRDPKHNRHGGPSRPLPDIRGSSVQPARHGKAEPKRDRRVDRTRKMLREALLSLMLERGWDGVRVQDVCDRADVGRSTFYTHFADKEELLVGGFDDLRKALHAEAAASSDGARPLGFARGLVEHVGENQRLFRALMGKKSGQLVLCRFRDHVLDLVRDDVSDGAPGTPAQEAVVHLVAGAFVELVTWWLEGRTSLSAADVEKAFTKMAGPVVHAARR